MDWKESENMLGVTYWSIEGVGSVSQQHGSDEYEAFSWLTATYMPLGKFAKLSEAKNAVLANAGIDIEPEHEGDGI